MSRRRRWALAGVAVAGVVVGALGTTVVDRSTSAPPPAAEANAAGTAGAEAADGDGDGGRVGTGRPGARSDAAGGSADRAPAVDDDVLLVWTAGGLPPTLGREVATLDATSASTEVRAGETRLTGSTSAAGEAVDAVPSGWHVPLDTLAVEPSAFAPFVEGDAARLVGSLPPGHGLLTETSARLRRVGPGATLHLEGGDVVVAGVVDDRSGAGAELVVRADDGERLGVTAPRYLLVAHDGDREALQRAVADHLDGRAVRFRTPAETTWLRHGDAVEPAARLKAAYGEFAVRDRDGRNLEADPAWVARSIVTEEVPILGPVTCHRLAIGPLRDAMADLERHGRAHLVEPAHFAGCYAPRRTGPGQPLSHHAWGAAVDLNVDGNPRGSFSTQDDRLVATMQDHGFSWGGTWLVPDPAHYEAPLPGG